MTPPVQAIPSKAFDFHCDVRSAIVCPRTQNNFPYLEKLRREMGADLLFLYDVSPPGTVEELEKGLREYSRIAILDHHGAAGAIREVPGMELTAAEVAIAGLKDLEKRGVFREKVSRVVLATHSMNVDPDAFVTRLFLKSYFDRDLHPLLWPAGDERCRASRWQHDLVEAARFGDTRFFGGYDYSTLSMEQLAPPERLAVAIFQFIIEEKENCVILNRKTEAAVLHNLQKLAVNALVCGEEFDRQAALSEIYRLSVKCSISLDEASVCYARRNIGESMDLRTARWYDASLLSGDRTRVRSAILDSLSRDDIREVFIGRKQNPYFPINHPPLFNEAYIDRMGDRIGTKILDYLHTPQKYENQTRAYLDGLRWTKQIAESCTVTECKNHPWLSVTVAKDRLDLVPGSSDKQFTLVYDWLREAAAAFGGAYLHLMVRPRASSIVISSRFPRPEEAASFPTIHLNSPAFCNDLNQLEKQFALEAGAPPTAFLFKTNLVLPLGPVHIPQDQIVALLEKHLPSIITAGAAAQIRTELHEVMLPDGRKAPFDGTRWIQL